MTKTYTVPPAPPHNEGKTPAAWTLTLSVVLGSVVVAVGMILAQMLVIAVGAGLMVLGVAAGVVMSLAGLGKKRTKAATS